MAAYGLYTHIQSNKRRSVALLIGLFLLVYLLVYAGALVGEALAGRRPLDWLLRAALARPHLCAPWATLGTALWIFIAYKFHQSMIDAVTGGREVTRQEEPRLYNLLENLCISRGITDAEAQGHGGRRAQCLRHRHEREAIFDHGHDRPARPPRRCRGRGGARPRADPYPQRRRAHAGDRRDHRRRDLVLRRAGLPAVVPERLRLARRPLAQSSDGDRKGSAAS